jgi:hypothetical protein
MSFLWFALFASVFVIVGLYPANEARSIASEGGTAGWIGAGLGYGCAAAVSALIHAADRRRLASGRWKKAGGAGVWGSGLAAGVGFAGIKLVRLLPDPIAAGIFAFLAGFLFATAVALLLLRLAYRRRGAATS